MTLPQPRAWQAEGTSMRLPGLEVHLCDIQTPTLTPTDAPTSRVVPLPPPLHPEPPAVTTSAPPRIRCSALSPAEPVHSIATLLQGACDLPAPDNPIGSALGGPCALVMSIALDIGREGGDGSGVPSELPDRPARVAGEAAAEAVTMSVSVGDITAHLTLAQWRVLTRLVGAVRLLPALPPLPGYPMNSPSPEGVKARTLRLRVARVCGQVEPREGEEGGAGQPMLSARAGGIDFDHRLLPRKVR